MMGMMRMMRVACLVTMIVVLMWSSSTNTNSRLRMVRMVSGIGANWGTQASHPLPPDTVVRLLKDNGFQRVKLFDADYDTLNSLAKSGIEVMVGIPNDMLASLATSVKAAEKWVSKNVSAHISSNNVKIRSLLAPPSFSFSPLSVHFISYFQSITFSYSFYIWWKIEFSLLLFAEL